MFIFGTDERASESPEFQEFPRMENYSKGAPRRLLALLVTQLVLRLPSLAWPWRNADGLGPLLPELGRAKAYEPTLERPLDP